MPLYTQQMFIHACTGISLKADLISTFANIVPLPKKMTSLITSSILMYLIEHNSLGIPSSTLWFCGCDRSMMSLHLLGWWFFGITPNLLYWIPGSPGDTASGPATLEKLYHLFLGSTNFKITLTVVRLWITVL